MAEQKRQAIAQVVLHGREQLVLVRPFQRLLVLLLLHRDQEVAKPAAFEEDLAPAEISQQERELARLLIEASTAKEFTPAQYRDAYTEKLTQLIEAKVAGQEIVAPPYQEQAPIINLMEALRQSVAQAQKRGSNEVALQETATDGKQTRSRKRKSS
jgi:DNA end-binding protein Ku